VEYRIPNLNGVTTRYTFKQRCCIGHYLIWSETEKIFTIFVDKDKFLLSGCRQDKLIGCSRKVADQVSVLFFAVAQIPGGNALQEPDGQLRGKSLKQTYLPHVKFICLFVIELQQADP